MMKIQNNDAGNARTTTPTATVTVDVDRDLIGSPSSMPMEMHADDGEEEEEETNPNATCCSSSRFQWLSRDAAALVPSSSPASQEEETFVEKEARIMKENDQTPLASSVSSSSSPVNVPQIPDDDDSDNEENRSHRTQQMSLAAAPPEKNNKKEEEDKRRNNQQAQDQQNDQQQQQLVTTSGSSNTGSKISSNNNSINNMKRTLAAKKLARKWLTSFRGSDPRWQLVQFFCEELCHHSQDHKLVSLVEDATEHDRDKKDAALVVHKRVSSISSLLLSTTSASTTPSVFTVWRPTSAVAIRRMIAGQATGKGLEIKGKSAKAGQLSGFVPFLQIHVESHKSNVGTIQKDGRVRVFYSSRQVRDAVMVELESVRDEMLQAVEEAKNVIFKSIGRIFKGPARTSGVNKAAAIFKKSTKKLSSQDDSSSDGVSERRQNTSRADNADAVCSAMNRTDKENGKMERDLALRRLLWDMVDPSIEAIDTYAAAVDDGISSTASEKPQQRTPQHECYGIDMPNRLLWQAFVANADISRPQGSKHYTARPSQPAFQDLNWIAINKTRGGASGGHNAEQQQQSDDKDDSRTADGKNNDERRVVLWHTCRGSSNAHDDDDDPMDPRCLVMAYEEHGRVLPVVSDFDCFTMGTRGIDYQNSSLPDDQVELIKWCLDSIEGVLDNQEQQQDRDASASPSWTSQWLDVLKESAVKGFHPVVPKFGFGDVQSYKIMERAVSGLQGTGAVRHGAENFNYYFPQELDDEFLIVCDALPDSKAAWEYVNVQQLQSFLLQKIGEGFTFPLNPKWILCDPGWKEIYNRLLSSQQPAVQDSLNVWFPPDSGIRELISTISTRHPSGFALSPKQRNNSGKSYTGDVDDDTDDDVMGTEAMDLATLQLERYMTLRRAKAKIRAAMKFGHFLALLRQGEESNAGREELDSTLALPEEEVFVQPMRNTGDSRL